MQENEGKGNDATRFHSIYIFMYINVVANSIVLQLYL
jgi:hypothetical protein